MFTIKRNAENANVRYAPSRYSDTNTVADCRLGLQHGRSEDGDEAMVDEDGIADTSMRDEGDEDEA